MNNFFHWSKDQVTGVKADRILKRQLQEAEGRALEHAANAEEHLVQSKHDQMLADMYKARAERLKGMMIP